MELRAKPILKTKGPRPLVFTLQHPRAFNWESGTSPCFCLCPLLLKSNLGQLRPPSPLTFLGEGETMCRTMKR